jgi:hypothetical protein
MVWSGTAYRSLEINENGGGVAHGYSAEWVAETPSDAVKIVGVYTPTNQVLIDCKFASDGFTGQFFWGSSGTQYGTQAVSPAQSGTGICFGFGINRTIQPSRYFGWAVGCYLKANCNALLTSGGQLLGVRGISLQAEEDSGPGILPLGGDNIWYESGGWVRGTWSSSFASSDPSGVCQTAEVIAGQMVWGPGDTRPDTSSWKQCPDLQLTHQVDTTRLGNGGNAITLYAKNAAGVWSGPSETIHVDNQPAGLALSGPTDALASAGTQYVTAAATAGPSGVHSINCTLDGRKQVYSASSARIAVQGLGVHHLSCVAYNNARDSSGALGSSAPENWTLSIRQPSVSTVSFAHLADVLRCAKKRERVQVPSHWTTERVHGHKVRVHIPAQTRTIKVVRCHPHVIKKRVKVGGRWVIKRIVVLPRTVQRSRKRVHFGKSAMVSGWLGTQDGNALGGQRVAIATAPNNGRGHYTVAATTTTASNGTWSVRLPAGPSRIVRAVYGGSATIEPAISSAAHLIVPASVALSVTPRRTHWGGKIAISGQLRGRYVPHAGELVVLWISWRGGKAEIGHIYARRHGRFATPYTFLRGRGTQTYRIWAVSAREGDYPYAPNRSRAISVTVGP